MSEYVNSSGKPVVVPGCADGSHHFRFDRDADEWRCEHCPETLIRSELGHFTNLITRRNL